jgi:hypothetical protein
MSNFSHEGPKFYQDYQDPETCSLQPGGAEGYQGELLEPKNTEQFFPVPESIRGPEKRFYSQEPTLHEYPRPDRQPMIPRNPEQGGLNG